jgi:hypothetical protein
MDPIKASYQFRIDTKIIQLSVWQSLPPATAGEQLLPIGLHNYADQNVPRGRSSNRRRSIADLRAGGSS